MYPEWDRTCGDCKSFIYEMEPSSPRIGLPMLRAGKPVEQSDPPSLPCHRCPKVLSSARAKAVAEQRGVGPEDAHEPDAMHFGIVSHFLTCEAVRRFPRDYWTGFFARLIRPVLEQKHQQPMTQLVTVLERLTLRLR